MSLKKTYFLAPARHSTPLGVIALGNIIEDPRSPEIAINDTTSEAVKKLAAKAIPVEETSTFTYLAEGSNAKASVMAKVLEGFGNVGGGAGLSHSHDMSSIYKIDKMTTLSISPTLQEVQTIFNESSIQGGLRSKFFTSRVYMITSIRVVYGAEAFASTVRAAGGFLHFTADLTPSGAPVNIGSTLEAAKSNGQIMSTKVSDKTPFVLAYRLREIVYKTRKVKEQKAIDGDMLNTDYWDEEEEEEQEDPADTIATAEVLEDEDPELAQYLTGFQTADGEDVDGEGVQLAVTTAA
ncbi:hypothetical protein CONLIGDRAFT_666309 [Coniochaeta ligniaria NRRL 30616]|uniref:Uncharacterized protein n=1 Tax=Coniochaeta ligniaria NRRL 30616 TaxID=1408157 RepID=A0A1J7JSC1_9PEZI|nr:hypothetical protein CONLIGDRAFT_666309 [Coniochaeta ligniaria NRRL 30616]